MGSKYASIFAPVDFEVLRFRNEATTWNVKPRLGALMIVLCARQIWYKSLLHLWEQDVANIIPRFDIGLSRSPILRTRRYKFAHWEIHPQIVRFCWHLMCYCYVGVPKAVIFFKSTSDHMTADALQTFKVSRWQIKVRTLRYVSIVKTFYGGTDRLTDFEPDENYLIAESNMRHICSRSLGQVDLKPKNSVV